MVDEYGFMKLEKISKDRIQHTSDDGGDDREAEIQEICMTMEEFEQKTAELANAAITREERRKQGHGIARPLIV